MNMLLAERRFTAEELLAMPNNEGIELLDGILVESKMGAQAGRTAQNVNRIIDNFALERQSGMVFPPDAGYQIFPESPNRIRKPDGSFIKRGRLPDDRAPKGYITIVPDLLIEVVSPNDEAIEVEQKIADFLRVNVPLMWILYPDIKSVYVFRHGGAITRLTAADTITGEDVLPGFTCRVETFFEGT
jgi:Uma2 family endonuclease